MTIQNQESGMPQKPEQESPQSDSADLDRIRTAVDEHDGLFVGDDFHLKWGHYLWAWDLTGMWEKCGRVGLSASFDSDGLSRALLSCGVVVGSLQRDAFCDDRKIENPRDTSGDIDRVLTWIENIEIILGQPSIEAAKDYVRGLEGPDHQHAWVLHEPAEQIARCTDWFCQARFYPASGVLGAEVQS